MTKKILLSTVVAASLATSAFAGGNAAGTTTARLDALGLNNTQTTDFASIWANPANVASMGDQAYLQSNNQAITGGFGGAVYDAGFGKIGLFVERNSFYTINTAAVAGVRYTSAAFTLGPAGAPAIPALNNQIDLIYGLPLGKNLDFGVRLSYSGNDAGTFSFSDSVTPTNSGTATAKASDLEIEVGANLKSLGIDVALSYGLPTIEQSISSTPVTLNTLKSDAMVATATVGHNLALKKGKNLRTVVYASSSSLGSKATDGTTTEAKTNGTTVINASTTLSNASIEGTTTYLSIGARYSSNIQEFNDGVAAATITTITTGSISVPVVAAIETKTSENWTVRGGLDLDLWSLDTSVEKQTINSVDQGTWDTAQPSNNVVNINFGAGYTKGNFGIDTVIAGGFTGGNLLANASAKLSANYKF